MLLVVAVLCSILLWTHSLNSPYIQPQQDFDLRQFAGEWYRVGLAYDNPLFIRYKARMQINKGFLDVNEDGGANLTMWELDRHNICIPNFYKYEKTDVPGLFTYFSRRSQIEKDITVVETNYTDYGVVLKYRQMEKEYTQLALYGRTSQLSPELVEKFKSYALSLGFSEESIVMPDKWDLCPHSDQSNTTETVD